MPTPAISVLMPFHDAAATIGAAMRSILRQSQGDFELLAIDDGSLDASATIVAAAARNDPRIRLLQPGRLGLVGALNYGIARAAAPLIARMDADDLMHPRRLELQADALATDAGLALIASRVALFPRQLVRAGYREYVRWQNQSLTPAQIAAAIYVESPFAHPSVMLRRTVAEALGGYGAGDFPEDYDLWLRMHRAGLRMARLPQVLLAWRERPDRTSRVDPRYARAAFDHLRARFLAIEPLLRQGRPLVYWGAGRPTRQRAQHLIAHGFPPAAWIDIDPRKIGQRIAGVPVYEPAWLQQRPRPFVLVYVTNHGARDLIDAQLTALGYVPGLDYLGVG